MKRWMILSVAIAMMAVAGCASKKSETTGTMETAPLLEGK